jgi:hypothetical protein
MLVGIQVLRSPFQPSGSHKILGRSESGKTGNASKLLILLSQAREAKQRSKIMAITDRIMLLDKPKTEYSKLLMILFMLNTVRFQTSKTVIPVFYLCTV